MDDFAVLDAGAYLAEPQEPPPVVALTGAFGGGLTTVARHLEQAHGFIRIHISSEIAKEWHLRYGEQEPLRSDLQRLGDELRQTEGRAALLRRAFTAVKLDGLNPVVVESIKNVGEIQELRRMFGYRLLVIAVMSDFPTRSSRALAEYEGAGLGATHLADDDQRDRNEEVAYGQQVELCVDLADIVLINNGAQLEQVLLDKTDKLIGLITGEQPRPLDDVEIYMHAAYSIARSSKCIKRHVGSVLVDSLGQVVSAGFNENPTGTKPCVEEESYDFQCYRDIVRNEHFETISKKGASCPVCGSSIEYSPGPPWRCANCAREGRKTNLEIFYYPDRAISLCTAVHAEIRAILAAGERARGSTLYTTTFPCMQCAEKITQAGIEKVVYTEAYPDKHGIDRLRLAKIAVSQFEGVRSSAVERLFPSSWTLRR